MDGGRDQTATLREDGVISWDWIVDETRSLDDFRGSTSIKDWMLEVLPAAKLDPWAGLEPLILTESRSLAGVLRNAAGEYSVRIAPTNGQCAGFLHTDVGPGLRPHHRILYLGDFDLAANTRRVLEREVVTKWDWDGGDTLEWERLALTEAQVVQYDLPRIIKHDRRFKDGGAHETV